MSKDKLTPKLRFPEFEKADGWKENDIGKLFKFKQGVQVAVENQYPIQKDGMVRFIRIIDITSDSEAPRYIENPGQDHLIEKNDLFMIRYGTPGLISMGFSGVIANNLFRLIWNNGQHFVAEYWFYSFQNLEKTVYNLSGSSSMPAISFSTLDNLNIRFPNNPQEQKKIASCLSTLDELIAAHNDKLDALKDHKKGLMQNLFPQEGETVPKVRFSEFEGDGEWVEKSLIETTNSKIKWSFTGGPFGSNLKASDYTSEGIRIIQLQNIGDGEFHDDNKIYTSLEKADELLSCNIYSGDIIISKMGDPVGRACLIPSKLQRCVMASDGIRFVVDENKHSKYFIYSLLNSKRIRHAIESKSTGSTRKRIGLDALRETELIIPKNLKEQQKIASCLSVVDDLINAQKDKIEQLQQHKKGLMQGLFPKIV
jgi:type I restriction enzyme S subunit